MNAAEVRNALRIVARILGEGEVTQPADVGGAERARSLRPECCRLFWRGQAGVLFLVCVVAIAIFAGSERIASAIWSPVQANIRIVRVLVETCVIDTAYSVKHLAGISLSNVIAREHRPQSWPTIRTRSQSGSVVFLDPPFRFIPFRVNWATSPGLAIIR